MPIEFASAAHQRIHAKVGAYLAELPYPFQSYLERPSYLLETKNVRVNVSVQPRGDDDALVRIVSYAVSGARVTDPELMQHLLRKNAGMLVGGFGVDDDGDIFLDHTLLGSTLTRAQLGDSLVTIASNADSCDDEIVARWGGRRAVDPPTPDGGALRRDDPGKRVVHAPRAEDGPGKGKAVFLLFGYSVASERDQSWLKMEMDELADDIDVLRKAGYTVVVDPQATRQDFVDAVAEKGEAAVGIPVAGIYWSGHGNADGSLATCDGGTIQPSDVDPSTASKALRLVVLSSCYVGSRARTWRKALGGSPLVVGWGRPVSIDRALDFLRPDERALTDLDDLMARYLLGDAPIPPDEGGLAYSPAASIAVQGRVGDVPARMKAVCAMLGASMEEAETHVRLCVPLDAGRSQIARVAIVESGHAFAEGEPLLAVESDVGELTRVVETAALLDSVIPVSYARFAIVRSDAEAPTIVSQGFLPLARVREQDLAALVFQVCKQADALEHAIFGTNQGLSGWPSSFTTSHTSSCTSACEASSKLPRSRSPSSGTTPPSRCAARAPPSRSG